MAGWIDRLKIDGEKLDARVEANLSGGELLRTMDGASSLTLDVHDPNRELLSSGLLARRRSRGDRFGDAAWTRLGKVQASLDGSFFRLAGVSKTGSILSLTFEDEIVALLRTYDELIRQGSANTTRAQFIRRVLSVVKERKIISYILALDKHQRTKHADIKATKIAQQHIPLGSHLLLHGNPADRDQIRNMNTVLDQAAKDDASERPTLALIEACIVEAPDFRNPTGGDASSVGILQLLAGHLGGSTSTRGGRRDIALVTHMFLTQGFTGAGGAIALARKHPSWNPGQIAQAVQGSDFPDRYEATRGEAEKILEAYGGVGRIVQTEKRNVYRIGGTRDGEHEDYWEGILRLADEVNWRAFTANNVFFYAADDDLIRAEPAITIAEQPTAAQLRRGVQYVGDIDFEWDYGKPASELTFSTPAERWVAYPGSTCEVLAKGDDPRAGRWLNWQFRQPLNTDEMEITLRRPSPAKPEPAGEVTTSRTQPGEGVGQDLLRWARGQIGTPEGSSKQIRWAQALGFYAGLPWCSIFLAYGLKTVASNVELPANPAYSGAWLHWTGGKRISKSNLRPGDLVIFDWGDGGRTDHVAIYAGRDHVIGGNQGNKVSSVPLNSAAIVGCVRVL